MQPRNRKILLAVAGVLVTLLVLVLLLSVISWNAARPWIAERVSNATQRPFAIHGDLVLNWRRPQELQQGSRRWVPWPHLRAHDVVLGNPDWASTGPEMARVQQVDFSLHPFALFARVVRIPELILSDATLLLEIAEDGRNNWTFGDKKEESRWQLDLQELTLNDATVRLVDVGKQADVTARMESLDDGSVQWKLSGKVEQDAVSGGGTIGALTQLQDSDTPYPFEAELKVGDSEIAAAGTVSDPRRPTAIDLNLKIKGASMAQLFPISGLVLPATPRFSTEGRLLGSFLEDDFHLRYEKFSGKVGSSDIGGTLEYRRGDERTVLRGDVVSNHLNLRDLGALLGTDDAEARKKRGDQTRQPEDKVIPVGKFRTERWTSIDAEVTFKGKKIIRSEDLPLDNLSANIVLKNGVLELTPLNFGVAGGRFTSELRIDGRKEPAQARLQIAARGLKLNRLFPKVEQMKASLGEVHGNAELTGSGNSLAALADSANGEVKAFVSEGSISKFILEAMGLNIGSIIVTQLFGDHQVQLNCLASDFEVKGGIMLARTFVVDTEDAIITVDGGADLGAEELGITIYPESKGVRLFSLRSPLYVEGTFKKPEVGLDKGTIGLKAGAAAALGAVASPLAALLALVNPGPEEASPCPGLLKQAKEKPQAPAPGAAKDGRGK